MSKVSSSDETSVTTDEGEEELTDAEIGLNYTIPDFTVKNVGDDEDVLIDLNEFFNSSPIKSELHWFTHRETLERAANREDRRLYYIAPGDRFLGGLMIWCESRVLESDQSQIRLVAVNPNYRNYGIGSYLVAKSIDFARQRNKDHIIADVSAESPAVEFWTASGFSQTKEYQTNGGRRMYRMSRTTEP